MVQKSVRLGALKQALSDGLPLRFVQLSEPGNLVVLLLESGRGNGAGKEGVRAGKEGRRHGIHGRGGGSNAIADVDECLKGAGERKRDRRE
jgi:hypothetical protein